MTTVHQDDLAHTAKQLRELYVELHQAKYERPPAPEVSTTRSNRQKGPMDPAPIWTLSDDAFFTERLKELVCDAAGHVDSGYQASLDGRKLTNWIAWHAGPVSQLDFADDILDEMRWQIRELDHKLRRTRPFVPAGEQQEIWLTARTLTYKLRQQGYSITGELLRKWAERGRIRYKKGQYNQNLYALVDVIAAAQSTPPSSESE